MDGSCEFPYVKGRTMTTSNDEPLNDADLRGPGDPDEAKTAPGQGTEAPQSGQHPELPGASNIREEQQAHAGGTVPASWISRKKASLCRFQPMPADQNCPHLLLAPNWEDALVR